MHPTKLRLIPFLLALLLTAFGVGATPAHAELERKHVFVPISGSYLLKTRRAISRLSVAASDVADLVAFPPNEVLITGKRVGITSATLWLGKETLVIDIVVGYPLEDIEAELTNAIPGSKELEVRQAGAAIVLSGQVPGVEAIERAEQIVAAFMEVGGGQPNIVNTLTVHGNYQVQLEVQFAEVSRSSLRQIGLNFWSRRTKAAGGLVAPTASGLATTTAGAGAGFGLPGEFAVPLLEQPLGGTFGAIFSSVLGDFPFSATLSLLANNGFARVLAEPTLVAMSGHRATFLAGGEFPIPVPQGLGQLGVEFKKFGIQVEFAPTVVDDTIQLAVNTIVSDIDFSLGLKLAGVTVPGLTQRSASSTVRLRDGQSFVLAGLLSDRTRSSVDKVPLLGNLPVLGMLFRSSSYRREETELLVVVTANLVRPLDERPKLPGEDLISDPNDLELFVLGRMESMALSKDDAREQKAGSGKRRKKRRSERTSIDQQSVASLSPARLRPVGTIGFKR